MFNPLTALAASEVVKNLKSHNSILDFGSQTFDAAGVIQGTEGVKTTQEFYQRLNFERYLAVDVNTHLGAEIYDLNQSLAADQGLEETFDLVVNNGTSEHIFDQRSVFENAHTKCKVNGAMLHVLPMTPYLNHGFYNYNPTLFSDIAAANKYEWLFLWFGGRDGKHGKVNDIEDFVAKANPNSLGNLVQSLNSPSGVLIVAALRKTVDAPFRVPMQGVYLETVQTLPLKNTYQRS